MSEGKLLGRYELLEPLGEGGMGAVWLARLTGTAGFEKLCIVKTVLPSIAKDADFVSRFLHEGRVLTQLSHGNIAQVLDMNEADGQLFIALEYIAGVDLARLHEQVRAAKEYMPLPMVVALITQAAEGLGAAHRKFALDGSALNVVHRDVSPHNIMVSYEGEVKVIDFGIAKSEARSRHTAQASVMGKLGYMAPEQARGESVDHRADQFALSIVAWELLSNQSWVRRGTITEMVVAMAHPTLRPLAPLRADVPPSLEAVVLKALSPLPDDRYLTTDEFAQVLMGELLRLGPPPTKPQLGQYVRSRCSDDFAQQRQLLTRVSTQRSPPPTEQRPKADMFAETVVKPGGAPLPPQVDTGALTAPGRPTAAGLETTAMPVPGPRAALETTETPLGARAAVPTIEAPSAGGPSAPLADDPSAPVSTISAAPGAGDPSAPVSTISAAPIAGAAPGSPIAAPHPGVAAGPGATSSATPIEATSASATAIERESGVVTVAGARAVPGGEQPTSPLGLAAPSSSPAPSANETSPARPAVMPAAVDPLPRLTPAERPSVRLDNQAVPSRAQLPLSTGEMAVVNPGRGRKAVVIAAVVGLAVVAAIALALREPEELAKVEPVLDAGVLAAPPKGPEVVLAAPQALDAGALLEGLDAGELSAALPPPVMEDVPPEPQPNLRFTASRVGRTWFVTNQDRRNWTRCRLTLPGQYVCHIGTLPHGRKVELSLTRFVPEETAPQLQGQARVDCSQGFGLLDLP